MLAEQKPLWAPTSDTHVKPGCVLYLSPPPSVMKIAYRTPKPYKQNSRYNLTFIPVSHPASSFFALPLLRIMKICNATPLANLHYTYRLVAETGGHTIEQLEWVKIPFLKYLTDRADDPIAIPASRHFPHTARANNSSIREGRGIGGSGFGPA